MKKTNLFYLIVMVIMSIVILFRGYFLIHREFKNIQQKIKRK